MIEYEIDIPEKLRKLNPAAAYITARNKHLPSAMERSVLAAKSAVLPLVPIGASGEARRSIQSQVLPGPYQIVGKVVSTMRRPNIYIYVLNSGRPAGKKMASSTQLEPWVQAKGLASNPTRIRQVAFLIARAVQRKGIKGYGFFWNGLEKTKKMIDSYHKQAIDAIVRDLEND